MSRRKCNGDLSCDLCSPRGRRDPCSVRFKQARRSRGTNGDDQFPNLSFTFDATRNSWPDCRKCRMKGLGRRGITVERSLLKDRTDSIASSPIPVYRPVLNGQPNTKWIQTAANRIPASCESRRRKPSFDVIEFWLNAERESETPLLRCDCLIVDVILRSDFRCKIMF